MTTHRHPARLLLTSITLLLLLALPAQGRTVYQYGTLDGLFISLLEGDLTLKALLQEGDFGIGTFNDLDGEMLVLDGVVYQIDGQGQALIPALTTMTPFATVCHYDEAAATPLATIPAGSSYSETLAQLDAALPSLNYFYAVRIEGSFTALTTRSVHAQQRPYPGLQQIVDEQSVFTFENLSGTMVGFRCPAYAKGVNVPGWHFHFIDEARQTGGHVLSFTTGEVKASWLLLDTWTVALPLTDDFRDAPLGQSSTDLLKAIATD